MTTDAEKLAICRQRIIQLEEAINDFFEQMKETGQRRKDAYDRAIPFVENLTRFPEVIEFFATYKKTWTERTIYCTNLWSAAQADFKTAMISDPDLTPEMEEQWLKDAAHDVGEEPAERTV